MSALAVTKMHGTLNDFIVVDVRSQPFEADRAAFARRWCDRRAGIGADGVLFIESSDGHDAAMRVVNADGSEAEMCGNGMRCVVRYLHDRGEGSHFRMETIAGTIVADVMTEDPVTVRVDVGAPRFENGVRELPGAQLVVVGNPHAVIFTDDVSAFDILQAGAKMPGLNVHAVQFDGCAIRVRHHERGAGLTFACGTGTVACAAAAIVRGDVRSPVTAHVPGGVLTVEWDGHGHAFLTGPAERVFDAIIDP